MSQFETSQFGTAIRLSCFPHHHPGVLRLNNGSFGACPKIVLSAKEKHFNDWISNPDDEWHALSLRFDLSSFAVAKSLIGDITQQDNIAIVDNLTTAVSLLVHSIIANVTKPNSVIVLSNLTYNAVKLAVLQGCKLACDRSGDPNFVTVMSASIPFPLFTADADDIIMKAYEDTLQETIRLGKTVVLGFLDHITSLPCTLMPIVQLVALFRSYDVAEVLKSRVSAVQFYLLLDANHSQ